MTGARLRAPQGDAAPLAPWHDLPSGARPADVTNPERACLAARDKVGPSRNGRSRDGCKARGGRIVDLFNRRATQQTGRLRPFRRRETLSTGCWGLRELHGHDVELDELAVRWREPGDDHGLTGGLGDVHAVADLLAVGIGHLDAH